MKRGKYIATDGYATGQYGHFRQSIHMTTDWAKRGTAKQIGTTMAIYHLSQAHLRGGGYSDSFQWHLLWQQS